MRATPAPTPGSCGKAPPTPARPVSGWPVTADCKIGASSSASEFSNWKTRSSLTALLVCVSIRSIRDATSARSRGLAWTTSALVRKSAVARTARAEPRPHGEELEHNLLRAQGAAPRKRKTWNCVCGSTGLSSFLINSTTVCTLSRRPINNSAFGFTSALMLTNPCRSA